MFTKQIAVVHLGLMIIFTLFMCGTIFAAATTTGDLQLEDLIYELMRSSPELLAAEARYKASSLKPLITKTYPDPRLTFGWMSAGTILPGGGIGEDPNANLSIQVAQMIPFPGKRELRSKIAQTEAESLKWIWSAALNSRLGSLKAAFYELTAVYDLLDLLNENKTLLIQLQRVAEARYSAGKTMQQDLIHAGTELAILEGRQLSLLQKKSTLAAEINVLLNREPSTELGRPQKMDSPGLAAFEILKLAALRNSPLLKAQQAIVDGRRLQTQFTKKELYPDLDVMSGYYYMAELEDMWEVKAEVSLPIFSRSKQRKETARTGLELAEATQTYKSVERMLELRLRETYLKAETSRNLLELYSKRIVPSSRLALESSLASYEGGILDFFAVLANFTTIIQQRMNLYEQQSEYFRSVATLEELIGTEMKNVYEPKQKVEVQP